MKPRAVATAVLAVQAGLASPSVPALPDDTERWVRLRTPHFTICGDAGPDRVVRVGSTWELMREALSDATGVRRAASERTTIFVFRDARSFAPYKPGRTGEPRSVDGYFVPTADGDYVAIDASADPARALPALYHRYVHAFLDPVAAPPPWLEEGLAEVFSGFAASHGGVEVGVPIDRHVYWLGHHPWMSTADLLALDRTSPAYDESERQGAFYAQSWALVHQLLASDEERRSRFPDLFALGSRRPDPAAIAAACGCSAEDLDADLRERVRTGRFRAYRRRPSAAPPPGGVEPIDRAEVLYLLGDLLAHYDPRRPGAAREHLEAALALAPDRPDAWISLAWLELANGHPERARAPSENAVHRAPADGRAQYVLARSLAPEHTAEARAAFRACVEAMPASVDGWIGLARTYLDRFEGTAEGVDAARRAFELAPGRADAVSILAALTAASGAVDEARAMVDERLRPLGDVPAVRAAEEAVVRAALAEGGRLAAEGRTAEAERSASDVAEWARDPEVRLSARRAASELRAMPDPAATAAAARAAADARASHDRLVALYEEAVRAIADGELERGLGLLERVARESDREDLQARARAGIDETREALRRREQQERFRAAITLANDGKRAEAIRMLEDLRDESPAGALLQEIDKALRLLGA